MADDTPRSWKTERDADGIAWLTFDKPGTSANVLSAAVLMELNAVLAGLEQDLPRGVIVISAKKSGFVAGADIKEFTGLASEASGYQLIRPGQQVFDRLEALRCPSVAAIHGFALGGGLELALACDIRIAADSAEMGLTEVRLGIIPGAGGTQRLARIAGIAAAKELILTGRRIGATRARELGIVSEVVPSAELPAAAARWAAEIAAAAPLALGAAKRAIDEGVSRSLADGLEIERARYEEVLVTDDRNEGLAAFIEKRTPAYKGR